VELGQRLVVGLSRRVLEDACDVRLALNAHVEMLTRVLSPGGLRIHLSVSSLRHGGRFCKQTARAAQVAPSGSRMLCEVSR
jgi:hypothetical protein